MDEQLARIVRICREAIMRACMGRQRYTVNELLADFDAQVGLITTSEGPSKTKLPEAPASGGGPIHQPQT